MRHRWDRDYNRASRPPLDFVEGAKETLGVWFLLIFFAVVLGLVLKALRFE